MAESNEHKRYLSLVAEIREHDHSYHVLGKPTVSDAKYDKLFRELRRLEEQNPKWRSADSPTQRVGAPLPEGTRFERVAHVVPMISIESLFSPEDIEDFHQRVLRGLEGQTEEQPAYICEPKWDGVSASLVYESGVFVRGLSRGDGTQGEDITSNLKAVGGIPLKLRGDAPPQLLEVRGEVLMSIQEFEALNQRMVEAGEAPFANPRNSTSGTLKRLDPAIVADRRLRFTAFDVARLDGASFATHHEQIQQLSEWGFPTSAFHRLASNADEIVKFHDDLEAKRDGLDYEMDGIVAKVDQLHLRDMLGSRARTPRWACAHKFAPREETTQLLEIEVQVGRTGRLTPRARLDAVQLGGTTVQYATLHNAGYITDRDIRVGDRVVVRRAGDVIPQILGPVKEVRTGKEKRFRWPKKCPACKTEVHEKGEYRYCMNISCQAQIQRRVLHLASRRALRIEGLGEKAVAQFVEAGLLKNVEDIFHLNYAAVLELERWAQKSVDALKAQIDLAKQPDWARLLYAFGIQEVGEETARALADRFPTLKDLRNAVISEQAEEELSEVEGIGKEVAASIVAFFHEAANRHFLLKLEEYGVRPQTVRKAPASQGLEGVAGKSFVLTGTLELPRGEVKKLIEERGGKVVGSVSKKTDYVIVGEKPGSKARKAEDLNIPILDEAAMQELLQL